MDHKQTTLHAVSTTHDAMERILEQQKGDIQIQVIMALLVTFLCKMEDPALVYSIIIENVVGVMNDPEAPLHFGRSASELKLPIPILPN